MNKETLAELDQMSGLSQQNAQLFKFDEISINGSKGSFVIKRKTQDLVEVAGKKKYPKDSLGESVSLVFLKKRRLLVEVGEKGKSIRTTNEHNHPMSTVTLFQEDKNEVGIAKALREKYPKLHTREVIYAMDLKTKQIYRVIFKGASLKIQEDKEKVVGVTYLYDYLQSFKGEDERFYLYETVLTPIELSGELGTFYAINCQRGRKITDKEFAIIASEIKKINQNCEEADKKYQTSMVVTVAPVVAPEMDVIDYGEEEINVDDIPF
jgi:hypothetical protein